MHSRLGITRERVPIVGGKSDGSVPVVSHTAITVVGNLGCHIFGTSHIIQNIFRTRWEGYSRSESELANAVVEGWLNSPEHRENLLREGWAQEGIGVSVVENPDEGGTEIYVTQDFC